jgi:penicillin V acylase-like amidase (Ntn superfamily)
MCTRVFNNRNGNYLTTARNMDWKTQLPTTLFYFQAQLTKSALSDDEAENHKNWQWTSKYASIVTMVGNADHGFGSSDGINSAGLVANVLYAKKTNYTINKGENHKSLNVLRWVQYVLDNFQTAQEVADEFAKNEIVLLESQVPGSDSPASLHLSVSDSKGQSVIIEVYGGQYHIHNNPDYTIMTNEPNYNVQLKLNDYWRWQWSDENAFPSHTIPGGPFPADRFERAAYYYLNLAAPKNAQDSLAQSQSVVANASVPIGMKGFEGHPNIAPTIWTTLADHNQLKYYFCNARTPNVIWVEMNKDLLNVKVAKLDLVTIEVINENSADHGEVQGVAIKNYEYVGCVNSILEPTEDPYCVSEKYA